MLLWQLAKTVFIFIISYIHFYYISFVMFILLQVTIFHGFFKNAIKIVIVNRVIIVKITLFTITIFIAFLIK